MRFEIQERGGKKHLYLVDSERTEKGPRRTKSIYLGTPESIYERLLLPSRFKSYPLGKPLALIHAAREMGLLQALERHLPGDAEAVTRLIFFQIVGRADGPLSRNGMARHFAGSPVPALLGLARTPSPRQMLRALRHLFGTGRISPDGHPVLSRAVVRRIQGDVLRTMMAKGLDPKFLLFDTTNQYFHHQPDRWMRKGHNKQRRNDKNQLGVGMVTAERIPILSEVLPGNEADPNAFQEVFEALVKRLEALEVATQELAIVFDRGVNSTDNFDNVLGLMHVIAALDRAQARKLFARPLSSFETVAKDAHDRPILGFSTHWEGFGKIWRVLVTYREATAEHQRFRWERTKAKVLAKVRAWKRTGRASAKESTVMNKITDAIPRDYRSCFHYEVEARGEGKRRRYWPVLEVDPDGEQRLKDSWGKTAIITDLEEISLSNRELVEAFVLRAEIEDGFRWMKDRWVISMAPMWVWNEEAIPGHAFVVLMALALLMFLLWEARDLRLTMKQMMEALEEVRGAVVVEKGRKPWISLEPLEDVTGLLAARWHWKDMLAA